MITPKVIAVTGATGFIGSRIVERLVTSTPHHVRALTTAHGHMARLSVHPEERLTWSVGDLRDRSVLSGCFAGADVVVHCAFGSSGDIETRWAITVDGTRDVVEAARSAQVRRFIHLSTIDTYSPTIEGLFDESAERLAADPLDREYEQQKLASEEIAAAGFSAHLILQPGIVYGPFGNQWTVVQLERLAAGVQGLPTASDPAGSCNAIYIDDVANAALLGIEAKGTQAARLLLNGPDEITWGRFFDGLRGVAQAVETAGPSSEPGDFEEWEQALYRRTARADCSAAAEVLGWRPAVPLSDGLAKTKDWWMWAHSPMT